MKTVLLLLATLITSVSLVAAQNDQSRQTQAIKNLAAEGSMEAQSRLGLMYSNGQGVKKNPIEAAKWFEKSAKQRNATAHELLGNYFASGEEGSMNVVEAHARYKVSGALGNKRASVKAEKLSSGMTDKQKEEARKRATMLLSK